MGEPSLQAKIAAQAATKTGQKVGDGECFALADEALKSQGAKSAADFGTVTPTADYVWGTAISLTGVAAGDVLQFSNYERTTERSVAKSLTFPDGSTLDYSSSKSDTMKRPHHTAVVNSVPVGGTVQVLEQNVDRGTGVLDKTVGSAAIVLTPPAATTANGVETIVINAAWAQEAKRSFTSPDDQKYIDELVTKFSNKSVTAKVTTKESTTVKGTVKAYRAQAK